jgi:hypothetical protein
MTGSMVEPTAPHLAFDLCGEAASACHHDRGMVSG